MQTDGSLKGIFPAICEREVTAFCNRITEDRYPTEIILGEPAFEYFQSNHSGDLDSAAKKEQVTILTVDDQIPFGLQIDTSAEDVGIGVIDDYGRLKAFIVSNSSAAIDWSQQVYDIYREQATPLNS